MKYECSILNKKNKEIAKFMKLSYLSEMKLI